MVENNPRYCKNTNESDVEAKVWRIAVCALLVSHCSSGGPPMPSRKTYRLSLMPDRYLSCNCRSHCREPVCGRLLRSVETCPTACLEQNKTRMKFETKLRSRMRNKRFLEPAQAMSRVLCMLKVVDILTGSMQECGDKRTYDGLLPSVSHRNVVKRSQAHASTTATGLRRTDAIFVWPRNGGQRPSPFKR